MIHVKQLTDHSVCCADQMWGGDPSKMPRYYLKCMTRATILGRAFAALSPASSPDVSLDITRPSRFGKNVASLPHELRLQIYEQFLMIYEQRRRLWSLFAEIFRLGLLSGPDPEPGARFCSAILILTAGKAAWLIKDQLTASGTEWSWIDRSVGSPDRRWNMQFVLNSFVRQARELPRDNYRWNELIEERDLAYGNGQILEPREYVPLEVVDVFDKTLAKVEADEPDWNGAKIIETYERDWIKLWQRTSDINRQFSIPIG